MNENISVFQMKCGYQFFTVLSVSFQRAPTAWRARKTAGTSVWVTPRACLCGVHLLSSVLQSGCRTAWKSHLLKWPEWLRIPICLALLMIWVGSTPLIHHRASLQPLFIIPHLHRTCIDCKIFTNKRTDWHLLGLLNCSSLILKSQTSAVLNRDSNTWELEKRTVKTGKPHQAPHHLKQGLC